MNHSSFLDLILMDDVFHMTHFISHNSFSVASVWVLVLCLTDILFDTYFIFPLMHFLCSVFLWWQILTVTTLWISDWKHENQISQITVLFTIFVYLTNFCSTIFTRTLFDFQSVDSKMHQFPFIELKRTQKTPLIRKSCHALTARFFLEFLARKYYLRRLHFPSK